MMPCENDPGIGVPELNRAFGPGARPKKGMGRAYLKREVQLLGEVHEFDNSHLGGSGGLVSVRVGRRKVKPDGVPDIVVELVVCERSVKAVQKARRGHRPKTNNGTGWMYVFHACGDRGGDGGRSVGVRGGWEGRLGGVGGRVGMDLGRCTRVMGEDLIASGWQFNDTGGGGD